MAEETAAAEDAPEDPNTLSLEAREYGKSASCTAA